MAHYELRITGRRVSNPILTAVVGDNAEQFRNILNLYVKRGSCILDATYGLGSFWKLVNREEFTVITNDLYTHGADFSHDFRKLPFRKGTFEIEVLDPPYAQHGTPMKKSISSPYGCDERGATSEHSIIQMYLEGAKEAVRVLKSKGLLIIKTQDAIEASKPVFKHIVLANELPALGLQLRNIHPLVQLRQPAMRHRFQLNARQNHSYFMVFQKVA